MYSLQVKSRLSNSSSSSNGSKSIQLEGTSGRHDESSVHYDNDDDLLEDEENYHDSGRPLTPQSWVQKIGSAMFQKIKIAPSTESPVIVVKPAPPVQATSPASQYSSTRSTPTPPRPSKFQLQIDTDPVVETRIAMPSASAFDEPAGAPSHPRGSFGQHPIDFIKVYCSPKRQNQSPKIQPQRNTPAASTPPRRADVKPSVSQHDHDDDLDVSPSKRPEVRGDVVPVLQSFFARPMPSKDRKTSVHTIDKMIHRQEQYKRDLARQDQLRASAALSAHNRTAQPNDDTAQCKREVLRKHARSLKRQRMADIAAAKQILQARDEQNRRYFRDARESWEGAFEDEVAALAGAFAKASCRHANDLRPMTTAGLVVPEAQSQVERDKVLLQQRAQTAPTKQVQVTYNHTRSASPVVETTEEGDDSSPGTSHQAQEVGCASGYDWLERSHAVEMTGPDQDIDGRMCHGKRDRLDGEAGTVFDISRPAMDDTTPG
ncbi:hypothetical protein DYB32_005195 [Aphanomyces invadans]|uniref:Uncharacterized protein n=1 Tax=Aphanomyces invadans TaxID=157072 RepID=A0A3R6Z3Q5_9STRA|nr:hypothetical protein DYB32_005195 [Aphanomyces invadans]